ncbi:MAG: hypothetical protein A2233_00350 [Candidatus Kerfeldbacteria bacterium RIFOXYA2_FULL_38_24]|uniref:Glycosyltransferase 2-like domain-containing protein n=1 Tax=Candidatus Kerfeldbacteria bacterium RIFOXYB2_FULL_38_14 TaxID=1798547 RepID=A0A1G2BBG7_9BACT|nr:MAG: hypothetical protein A2233_00350 [Candidatus Kerfeldbacteria bacterium RIFOXYA2_FULL_38_24]OGY86046.1 MAG: hypothetical protein A2319_00555 [Candidatus Kerfeldbacteria bacterium RIFOXYB2_FULL_38_14]OGY90162.1 MAG: hypothetical protein A2458_04810 [Candidatus Kerfeldbacteria bacterium RIFOXYC2_FULL_38_9]
MNISVIIVSWNAKEHLRRCLNSIKQHTKQLSYEVIVVDNSSQDDSAHMVAQEFPEVKLVASKVNLGFGKANNRGAELATGEVLFFCNDDIVLQENSLALAYEKLTQDKSLGVLGFHLLFPDKTHQDSVRRFPNLKDQLIILTKLHNFFPNLTAIKKYLAQGFDYQKEQEVEQLMGACLFIRQDVFKKAQGFDEHFFCWFEEIDLEKRIKEQQKLRLVYSPASALIHVKGVSFNQIMSVKLQRILNQSMRYYFLKHHGLLAAVLITILQPLSIILSLLVQGLKKLGTDVKKMKHGQN